jgi:hypothetical protein
MVKTICLWNRYGSVSFVSEVCMTLHGMAGYFESTLYADEMLSIAPHSHTEGYTIYNHALLHNLEIQYVLV